MIIKENIVLKKLTNLVVSIQAQKILEETNYSMDEFVEWSLNSSFSLGGHDVMLFLEQMNTKKGDVEK